MVCVETALEVNIDSLRHRSLGSDDIVYAVDHGIEVMAKIGD